MYQWKDANRLMISSSLTFDTCTATNKAIRPEWSRLAFCETARAVPEKLRMNARGTTAREVG